MDNKCRIIDKNIEHLCRSIWTTRVSFLPPDGVTSKRKNVQKGHFLEKREGWRLGAIFPLYPLARGRRGREDNLRSKLVNLSAKRVNLIRILTKQTRKRVNPKTDKARRR